MTASLTPFHSSIPSNKFYPPHIDESQSLFRSHLIENVLPQHGKTNKVIAIEAQAGQGKTTLAYQYLNHYNHTHIWYQIGREDADPVLLIAGLLHSLKGTFIDFASPQLEEILHEGEIGPFDLMRCANILLGDIDRYLQSDLFIVFDDLHLIADADLTNNLLAYLLDTSPPQLHFVLTSRHPFELKSKTIRNRQAVSYLNTTDLALSSREIETLFNDVFNRSISVTDARKIEDVTSGWVMGIVLAAHPMSGSKSIEKANTADLSLLGSPSQKDMLEYFQDEIFTHIPAELHVPFLKLSFVDEIHVHLAERITAVEDIDIILNELTQENLFIYNLDRDFQSFRFHHLFQEFLQARAVKVLSKEEISTIYAESAAFFLENDLIDKALSCYQRGGDFKAMDKLIHRYGVDLLAQNRTLTILTLLQSIPEKTLMKYGWLTLFSGILGSDFQPKKTIPHLEAARKKFIEIEDETGELLALAYIIYYHFVVTGRYHTGASFLPRTEELLLSNQQDLSPHVIVLVSRNLAAGYCFFSADMEKARLYADMAKSIAMEHDIRNFVASTVFVKAYIELLSGNRSKFRHEVEISYSLMNDPLVGMSNKLTLRVMQICSLCMHGDVSNYFHQQDLLKESIDEKVVKQTITAPYVFVWGGICLTSIGETGKALDVINRGVGISATAKSEHMLSQLLQWQAYILALHGNAKSAEVKIGESAKLRTIAGGPFYESFHNTLAGAVYGILRKKKLAKQSFAKALKIAEAIPSPYLQVCCHMQRSYFKLTCYDETAALADLEKGLTLMIKNGYEHFWSWEPESIVKLLKLAVMNNIQREYSLKLARQRLHINITDNGRIIPILHFTLMDGFFIRVDKDIKLTVELLTPLQRELLCLVLIAKDKKISQEKVQLKLWPDSSPEKSRKKLDTLLGRLRATFSEHLNVPIKDYIVLNKGILSLENATTDLEEFFNNCEAGSFHAARGENWKAGNYFHYALGLWKSTLPSDTFRNDAIYSFEDILLATFEKICLQWSKILAEAGRHQEAIPIVEKLLNTNSLSESGVILLCKLYEKNYQPLKIRDTLEKYRTALLAADYEVEEIEPMMEDITAILEEG